MDRTARMSEALSAPQRAAARSQGRCAPESAGIDVNECIARREKVRDVLVARITRERADLLRRLGSV